MKKMIAFLVMVTMAAALLGGALAGVGDRTVMSVATDDGDYSLYIHQVMRAGEKVWVMLQGLENELRKYDLETGEGETFALQELEDRMSGLTAEEAEADGKDGDDEEDEEAQTENILCWFTMGDDLFALVQIQTGGGRLDGGHVRRAIAADGKVELEPEDTFTLDWSGMTYSYAGREESRYPQIVDCDGQKLYISSYGIDTEEGLQFFDLATGEMTERTIQNMGSFATMGDGKLLLTKYEYGEASELIVESYDPETEDETPICRFDLSEGNVSGLAYQAETETVYFSRNGEIFAAPAGDLTQAQAVNECPASVQPLSWLTDKGQLLMWGNEGVYLRNTDPALRSKISLRLRPYVSVGNLENVSNVFADEHGEVSLIRESEANSMDNLLQDMMNRDSTVDVYTIQVDSSAYNALYERGFLADLSGSEALRQTVEAMYPFAREAVEKDGKLVALPLRMTGWTLGYDEKALTAIGLTKEDLPTTWDGLFDFLEELPDRLPGTNVRALGPYVSVEEVKDTLIRSLLIQYAAERPDDPMNTPELQRLLDRVNRIPFAALDIATNEEISSRDDSEFYAFLMNDGMSLLDTYVNIQISSYGDNIQPLVLALSEEGEPLLQTEMIVAFVNPFSEHPEEAIQLLETMAAHTETETRYSLLPDLNEPMRYPDHEEVKAMLQKWLDLAEKNLKKAEEDEDEDEVDHWTEIQETYQKALEEFEQMNWKISPTSISNYRARAGYVKVQRWNFFEALNSNENGQQYGEVSQAFRDGTRSAADLLSFIDKKVQMMKMEGN